MSQYAGKNGVVTLGAATPDQVVGELTEWAITETARPQATRSISSEYDTFLDGSVVPKGWTGTMSGHWDSADAGQALLAVGDKLAGEFDPSGSTSGLLLLTGDLIITELEISTADEELISFSATFQGTGVLTKTPAV